MTVSYVVWLWTALLLATSDAFVSSSTYSPRILPVSATIDAKMPSPAAAVSPYTEEQLQAALDSLLAASSDKKFDARHMYGYGQPSNGQLSMLQRITATRLLDYQQLEEVPLPDLEQQAAEYASEHGRVLNLQSLIQSQSPRMALAAEFKRASPSKGLMADPNLSAGEQGRKYAEAGADIISVLTEERWFLGSLADLTQVREQTAQQRPAILRKDFVVNRRMIAEAAAAGADTILLIVAVLPQTLLKDLIDYARTLGMEALVEVHADVELEVALAAGAKVIGVNNRNLHTFQMDLSTSERIAEQLRQQGLEFHHHESPHAPLTLCALSGMSTADDVNRFRQVGLGMCLIGESLMRALDPAAAIRSLCLHPDDYAEQAAAQVSGAYTAGTKIVKVCGITDPEDALVACRAGASLIGVIFAEKSKRKVDGAQAKAVCDAVRAFGERGASQPTDFLPNDKRPALQHLAAASRRLASATRRPMVVGVFQNQDAAYIRQMVTECGLDLVQLHGQEGMAAANVASCGVPAIRVVDICVDPVTGKAADSAVDTILQSITDDPVAILLDTSIKGQKEGGGTGVAFDWGIAERVQNAGLPVIIAGGLTAESVADCVGRVRPFGVDVSSGVESSPGRKDPEKVRAFVKGAQQAAIEADKGF